MAGASNKSSFQDLSPQAVTIEQVVAAKIILDPIYYNAIKPYLDVKLFDDIVLKKALSIILSWLEEFGGSLKGGDFSLKLTQLNNEDRNIVKQYFNIVQQIKQLTFTSEVVLKETEKFLRTKIAYNLIQNCFANPNLILESDVLQKIEKAAQITLINNFGFDYFYEIDKHVQYLMSPEQTISTGWKWLDEQIGGGLLKNGKALYCFYGATNIGKSVVLANLTKNLISENKKVLLVSLEMSEQIYAKRMTALFTDIGLNALVKESSIISNTVQKYHAKHFESRLQIKEFPPSVLTTGQLQSFIDRFIKEKYKPDCLIIDYLNLLGSAEKGLNSYERIKKITEELRALSYIFEIPIVTATQTNRSGVGQSNPGLETTSESMGISMTADVQIALWREEEDYELNIMRFGLSKNRYGPAHVTSYWEMHPLTLSLKEPIKNISFQPTEIPGYLNSEEKSSKSASVQIQKTISQQQSSTPILDSIKEFLD